MKVVMWGEQRFFSQGVAKRFAYLKEFRFTGSEVFVKRIGKAVVLVPTDDALDSLAQSLDLYSDDFMVERDPSRAELQYGVSKSQDNERNQAALEAVLLPLDIADFSTEVTVMYGDIRAQLERQGQPIGPLDRMIAAHALSLDVPLVTNNTREFERVKGLRVEDWTT